MTKMESDWEEGDEWAPDPRPEDGPAGERQPHTRAQGSASVGNIPRPGSPEYESLPMHAQADADQARHDALPDHWMECSVCDQPFDMRELDQVIVHEHDGPRLATGIRGEMFALRRLAMANERAVDGRGGEIEFEKTRCSVCNGLQFRVSGGMTCRKGHGGAPPA